MCTKDIWNKINVHKTQDERGKINDNNKRKINLYIAMYKTIV